MVKISSSIHTDQSDSKYLYIDIALNGRIISFNEFTADTYPNIIQYNSIIDLFKGSSFDISILNSLRNREISLYKFSYPIKSNNNTLNWTVEPKISMNDKMDGFIAYATYNDNSTINASEKKYQDFANLLPEIVFEIDSELNIKFINDAAERFMGYSKKDFTTGNLKLIDIFLPEEHEKLKNSIQKNLSGKKITGNKYKIKSADGTVFIVEVYNNLLIKDGQVEGICGIAFNITEKEKAFNDLSEQKERYQAIYENAPVAYQSLDIKGNFIDVNPAWIELMGYSKEDIIGTSFEQIIVPSAMDQFKICFSKLNKEGKVEQIELPIIKNDNSIIIAQFSGRIGSNEDGSFKQAHCVFTDITNQKAAEEQLQELNATKDKFFSIIAHDLKNPFNDLIGFTHLLLSNIDKYDTERIKQFADIIHQSSKQAHNLLENLLDWSSSQTGKIKYRPEKVSVSNLIQENIALVSKNADKKNIQINFNHDSDLLITVDKNMFRTILRNLLSNAIKYTHTNGNIYISLFPKADHIQIDITDTGIGIEEKNLKKLFRLDEYHSTKGTNKEKGTGLGLLLCKEFVERNNGKIWVQSEINKGSTFSIEFPV